jgi:hypothetical protein
MLFIMLNTQDAHVNFRVAIPAHKNIRALAKEILLSLDINFFLSTNLDHNRTESTTTNTRITPLAPDATNIHEVKNLISG